MEETVKPAESTINPTKKRIYPLIGFFISIAVLLLQVVFTLSLGYIPELFLIEMLLFPLLFFLAVLSFIMALFGIIKNERLYISLVTILILVLALLVEFSKASRMMT